MDTGPGTDGDSALDLDEGAHEAVVADGAFVEISGLDDRDSIAEGDVDDAGLMKDGIRHVELMVHEGH